MTRASTIKIPAIIFHGRQGGVSNKSKIFTFGFFLLRRSMLRDKWEFILARFLVDDVGQVSSKLLASWPDMTLFITEVTYWDKSISLLDT